MFEAFEMIRSFVFAFENTADGFFFKQNTQNHQECFEGFFTFYLRLKDIKGSD